MDLECAFRGPSQCALHQDRCASGGQSLEPTNLSSNLCAHKYLRASNALSAVTAVVNPIADSCMHGTCSVTSTMVADWVYTGQKIGS